MDMRTIMKYMENDKKKKKNEIYMVILENLGQPIEETQPIPRTLIKRVLSNTYKIKKSSLKKSDNPISLELPGSKSITNRVLLLSALGEGTVMLKGLLEAEDTRIMINALKALKACTISDLVDNSLTITGNAGKISPPETEIYVGKDRYVH